jgi:hypothetical protein
LVVASVTLSSTVPAQAVRLAPSQVVSPTGTRAIEPALAMSGDGRTLVVWAAPTGHNLDTEHARIEARMGRVGRAWGGTQILGRDGQHPIAAIGADGTAAVAWSKISSAGGRGYRRWVYVSIAAHGHRFGRARLVAAGPRLGSPEGIEVQPGGRVVVLWSLEIQPAPGVLSIQPQYVYFALFSRGLSHEHVGIVGGQSRGGLSAIETKTGVVLVAFHSATPTAPANHQAEVASLPVDGANFTSPEAIEGEPITRYSEVWPAELSAGPGGAALALGNKIFPLEPNGRIGASIVVKESPSEVAEVEAVGREPFENPIGCCEVSVALPSDGAWIAVGARRRYAPLASITWSRAISMVRPVGVPAFGYPVPLTQAAGLSHNPRVVAAGAATLALWVQDEPSGATRVYVAIRPRGGTFSPAIPVSSSRKAEQEECRPLGNCQIAVAGSSRYAIAGWVRHYVLHVMTLTG